MPKQSSIVSIKQPGETRPMRDDEQIDLLRALARALDEPQPTDTADVRAEVLRLIEANRLLRKVGVRLISERSAKKRILNYFRTNSGKVIDSEELMMIGGISEYARRIRELRVQDGWPILSGVTVKHMRTEEGELPLGNALPTMKPNQYVLSEDRQDAEAAERWKLANMLRRGDGGVQTKLLRFFRANVGRRIISEELRYVAGDRSEWARRTRELRTEEGWPIVTKFTGDPELPMGVYVLARDEQSPPHDRHIPEITRREVMQRDGWACRWTKCGWSPNDNRRDPRFLEVHHVVQHAHGGSNDADNLVTLCNLHHDETHRSGALHLTSV